MVSVGDLVRIKCGKHAGTIFEVHGIDGTRIWSDYNTGKNWWYCWVNDVDIVFTY